MLKSFVGIASRHGLAHLGPEGPESVRLVRHGLRPGRVGFWAIVADADADMVRRLYRNGLRRDALRCLESTAFQIGRILPSDLPPR